MKIRIIAIMLFCSITPFLEANNQISLESIDVGVENYYPVGVYAKYKLTGVGVGAQANFKLEATDYIKPFAAFGYNYGISKNDLVNSFNDIHISIGATSTFQIIL